MSFGWFLVRFIGLALLVVVLQIVTAGLFPEFVPNPNLVLGLVVFLSFHEATPLSAILVFLLGLTLDVAGGLVLGPWAGAFSVVFAVIASVSQRVFIESYASTAFATFFASLVASGLVLLMTGILTSGGWGSLASLIAEACSTALFAPFVVYIARGWLTQGSKSLSRSRSSSRAGKSFKRF